MGTDEYIFMWGFALFTIVYFNWDAIVDYFNCLPKLPSPNSFAQEFEGTNAHVVKDVGEFEGFTITSTNRCPPDLNMYDFWTSRLSDPELPIDFVMTVSGGMNRSRRYVYQRYLEYKEEIAAEKAKGLERKYIGDSTEFVYVSCGAA